MERRRDRMKTLCAKTLDRIKTNKVTCLLSLATLALEARARARPGLPPRAMAAAAIHRLIDSVLIEGALAAQTGYRAKERSPIEWTYTHRGSRTPAYSRSLTINPLSLAARCRRLRVRFGKGKRMDSGFYFWLFLKKMSAPF